VAREIVLTSEGKERLEHELARLTGRGRGEIAERLRQALEMGRELPENTEYLAAQEDQQRLEQRIADLEGRLEGARVIECRRRGGAVEMGAHVRIRDRDARTAEEYDIVGSGEGDPEAGRISHDSPIGGALRPPRRRRRRERDAGRRSAAEDPTRAVVSASSATLRADPQALGDLTPSVLPGRGR
jgi:transcription elongation factor GreA